MFELMPFIGIVFKHTSGWGVDGYNWGSESAVRDQSKIRHFWTSSLLSCNSPILPQFQVRMVSTQNGLITDCKFTQTGMIGLFITDSTNIHVTKSAFTDVGYHGILIHYKQGRHILRIERTLLRAEEDFIFIRATMRWRA